MNVLEKCHIYQAVNNGILLSESQNDSAEPTFDAQGGADKSLARPTSPFRRTESIVSLERGVCSCAELQVSSCYRGWNETCQATRAISTTSRPELSSSTFFPTRQDAEGNSRHCERNIRGICKIVCHPSKTGWPTLKWWFFPLWCASSWTIQNSDHPRDYWTNSRANLGYLRISAKSIAEQLGISREQVGSIIHKDLDMRKLSAKWVPKYLNADQKRQRCQSSEKNTEYFRRNPNDFLSRLVTVDET